MTVNEESDGAVTILTIDRPEAHNAVNSETAVALAAAIGRFKNNDQSHVLVITGSGPTSFCAGADLKDIPSLLGNEPFCDSVGPMGFAKLDPGKVTIAAINGYCFAGGLELAAWCDFRIAEAHSEFGALNRRWGVPFFDGGTQRLPRIVGLGNALWLMESGIRIDANRAREIGFVQETVPTGQALSRAITLAKHIATYPQESLRGDRQLVLESGGYGLAEGLPLEDEARRKSLANEDMLERLTAFASGERPAPPRPEE
ncbi:enoyl-CoA hydratase-related protein [Arthrobacter sp. B2a2-09]|uniref:enoyl-CoA hydratase-related protein n=1 Tax=Arthrobacter sp. B2a2-09 TaxID=2952822 RepID=UPI0022CD4B95|nr:enoyl-CoA hydratase-related protein [Arthrobacter sp. B2a2-09]MCZ9880633.1 enoyl-CoA hydratase-related protein [Arthrobacter sp. B2a2-09]